MYWEDAPDIKKDLAKIVSKLAMEYVQIDKLVCFRSHGSSSRARARIWALPHVWQQALRVGPHYIVEVLSEKFDDLSTDDKKRVLIHELMHIPKNFSGSLLPHRGRGRQVNNREVEKLFVTYTQRSTYKKSKIIKNKLFFFHF